MPNAVDETSAVTATVFAKTFQPDPSRAIISEEPACDSEPRCHETQTELARANRVAILGQLSASIAEINQPISAVVMNAEAALRLLLAQPTDTECALGTSLTAPVRMPKIGTSGSMIVVLEKGQCDSHIRSKKNVGTRFNFNFSRCVPCERSAPRLPCASNGRRSSYRRAYTYQPAFLYHRCKKR